MASCPLAAGRSSGGLAGDQVDRRRLLARAGRRPRRGRDRAQAHHRRAIHGELEHVADLLGRAGGAGQRPGAIAHDGEGGPARAAAAPLVALGGHPEIERLSLRNMELDLERDSKGIGNWHLQPRPTAGGVRRRKAVRSRSCARPRSKTARFCAAARTQARSPRSSLGVGAWKVSAPASRQRLLSRARWTACPPASRVGWSRPGSAFPARWRKRISTTSGSSSPTRRSPAAPT